MGDKSPFPRLGHIYLLKRIGMHLTSYLYSYTAVSAAYSNYNLLLLHDQHTLIATWSNNHLLIFILDPIFRAAGNFDKI